MALNSQLQTYQILTNNNQMHIFCLSYFITTVQILKVLKDLAPFGTTWKQERESHSPRRSTWTRMIIKRASRRCSFAHYINFRDFVTKLQKPKNRFTFWYLNKFLNMQYQHFHTKFAIQTWSNFSILVWNWSNFVLVKTCQS